MTLIISVQSRWFLAGKCAMHLCCQPAADGAPTATVPLPAEPSRRGDVPHEQAERRQLTVLFCGLVGSTELSTRLDREDMSELLGSYRNCCVETIARQQSAKSWDLHGAVILAWLLRNDEQHDKVRNLLAPIYDRFIGSSGMLKPRHYWTRLAERRHASCNCWGTPKGE